MVPVPSCSGACDGDGLKKAGDLIAYSGRDGQVRRFPRPDLMEDADCLGGGDERPHEGLYDRPLQLAGQQTAQRRLDVTRPEMTLVGDGPGTPGTASPAAQTECARGPIGLGDFIERILLVRGALAAAAAASRSDTGSSPRRCRGGARRPGRARRRG